MSNEIFYIELTLRIRSETLASKSLTSNLRPRILQARSLKYFKFVVDGNFNLFFRDQKLQHKAEPKQKTTVDIVF